MTVNTFIKVFIALALLSVFPGLFAQGDGEVHAAYPEQHKRVITWNYDTDRQVQVYRANYDLKYKGYIEVSDKDDDITRISKNGYFTVSRIVFGNPRKIEIRSDENGKLTKKYFEGKTEGNYETKGRQWLSDILPDIVRRTGVGAEHRISRFYNKGGMDALLSEIDEIEDYSGAVRNLYYVIAVDKLDLSDSDLARIIPKMEDVRSNSTKGTLMRNLLYKYDLSVDNTVRLLETTSTLDYNTERASVLRVLNNKLNQDTRIMGSYFEIIEDMSINSEKGNVLKHLVQTNTLTNKSWYMLFESLEDFSLEREKGAVLLYSIPYLPDNESVVEAFIEAVDDMSSHYYVLKGEIMNTLVEEQTGGNKILKGNKSIILRLLATAEDYSSNSQKGLTMRKVNRMLVDDAEVLEAYADCLESVSDRIEKYNILLDLLQKQNLSKSGYIMVLEATENLVNADYQHAAGAVLRSILTNMPVDDELIYNFFEIVEAMNQNSTIEEVFRYINTNKRFAGNDLVVLKTIEAVGSINVAIERTEVLLLVQEHVKSNEQKLAYKYAVKEIDSDYLKRKALAFN